MSGGHLEKIGRPVVLENVSGGHFEEEKKKRLLLPFFHRGRTLNMLFFLLRLMKENEVKGVVKAPWQTLQDSCRNTAILASLEKVAIVLVTFYQYSETSL